MKKMFLPLIVSVLFSGCATVSKWEPTLNTKVDKNPSNIVVDVSECKVLASQAAGFISEGVSGSLSGAGLAAAEGAVGGALTGFWGAGIGAAVGAPVGAIASLWYSEYEANLTYKRAFTNCLWQRGHMPIN